MKNSYNYIYDTILVGIPVGIWAANVEHFLIFVTVLATAILSILRLIKHFKKVKK